MPTDIVDLREFYLSPLGLTTRRLLRTRVGRLWPMVRGERILALGYGVPLLRPFLEQGAQVMAMMPAEQGVTYWPQEGQNVSCFVDTRELPLEDESVDRVIIMHALESSVDPRAMLPEIWRVIKSGGQLLLIVPNRRGLWAHTDSTPFGTGEPYTGAQVKRTLRNHGFFVTGLGHALFAPPSSSRLMLKCADRFETYGERLFPGLGGVLVVEASKQVYAPILAKQRTKSRRLTIPMPSLPDVLPEPLPT